MDCSCLMRKTMATSLRVNIVDGDWQWFTMISNNKDAKNRNRNEDNRNSRMPWLLAIIPHRWRSVILAAGAGARSSLAGGKCRLHLWVSYETLSGLAGVEGVIP